MKGSARQLLLAALGLLVVVSLLGAAPRSGADTGLPDLSVTAHDLSFAGAKLKADDPTRLATRLSNLGDHWATGVVVRFTIDGAKVYETTLSVMRKHSTSNISVYYRIPSSAIHAGTLTFGVVLDPANTVPETNEHNNSAEIPIPITATIQNLSIVSMTPSPASPKPGQSVSWSIKILNGGNVKARNVKIALYAGSASADPVTSGTIPLLAPGTSTTKVLRWLTPARPDPAIDYPVRVVVDPYRVYEDSNLRDNERSTTLSFTVPDLTISPGQSWVAVSRIYPHQFSQIGVRVHNDGVTPVSYVRVAVFSALGAATGPRTELASTHLSLARGQTVDYTFDRVPLPSGAAVGDRNLVFFVVDPSNSVAESNEANNEISLERDVVARPPSATCPCLGVGVHDGDGNPVAATVQLHVASPAGDFSKTAGTDALVQNAPGYVIFDKLPATTQVSMTVSAAGFRTQTESFTFDQTDPAAIDRAYTLDTRAVLTGTVRSQAGAPLGGVTVRITGTDIEATTDAQGRYGFMLNGGTYGVRFIRGGYARIVVDSLAIAPLSTVTHDETMSATTVAYVSGTITDDAGDGLANTDIYLNGKIVGTTGSAGQFVLNAVPAGSTGFKFRHPGYVDTQFSSVIEGGNEYRFSFTMYKPSTEGHAERGTEIVSWHQHEGTPANAFYVPEYNVDVWWGLGRVRMALDYTRNGSDATLSKLTITNTGLQWECNKVEGEGEVETSAIDIPVTIAAGSCSGKLTQMDVYKVAIYSGSQEVWSSPGFWTTASSPDNETTKVFDLGKASATWDGSFQVRMWVRVQQRAVAGTEGDGAGALYGYHLDKKLITWYPQRPPTTVISTSWKQVGDYLLGILDNPVTAITSFTDLFTVQQFNQYAMEEVSAGAFPGAPPAG